VENSKAIEIERQRIEAVYRSRESKNDLYSPWQPGEIFMSSERKRVAAMMLHRIGKFPRRGDRCLEIGYGRLGWMADLMSWGLKDSDLYGVELDPGRAAIAQEALPGANLHTGDATKLSWKNNSFSTVISSTVFSSILSDEIRELLASEISRVLRPGGVLVWYDMSVKNPDNPNVRAIRRSELEAMFPSFKCHARSVTLAPPIARAVAKKSWTLATVLVAFPFLRSHLLAVLVKP